MPLKIALRTRLMLFFVVNHLNYQIKNYQRNLLKLCLIHHINIELLQVLDFYFFRKIYY